MLLSHVIRTISFGLLLSFVASADPTMKLSQVDGKNSLILTPESGAPISIPLASIPQGTQYYHWTQSLDRVTQWTANQGVTRSEMESRVKTGGGYYGGGLYTSVDSVNSIYYGDKVMVFSAPKNFLKISGDNYLKLVVKSFTNGQPTPPLNKINLALAEAGISGIGDQDNESYINWVVPEAVSRAKLGTLEDIYVGWKIDPQLDSLLEIAQRFPINSHPFLQRHFPYVQKALLGQPLSRAEKELIKEAVSAKFTDFDYTNKDKATQFLNLPFIKQLCLASGYILKHLKDSDRMHPEPTTH